MMIASNVGMAVISRRAISAPIIRLPSGMIVGCPNRLSAIDIPFHLLMMAQGHESSPNAALTPYHWSRQVRALRLADDDAEPGTWRAEIAHAFISDNVHFGPLTALIIGAF